MFSFVIVTFCLVNVAMQSSSQSCPTEISDPVVRFGNMCAVCACFDRWGDRRSCPHCDACSKSPLATFTVGPVVRSCKSVHKCLWANGK